MWLILVMLLFLIKQKQCNCDKLVIILYFIDEQSSNNFVRCFENKTAFNIDEQSSNNFVRCFENKTAFNIDEQSSNNFQYRFYVYFYINAIKCKIEILYSI